MKFIGFIILLLTLTGGFLHAEITDTVIVLKEVEAKGVRFEAFSTGAKVFAFDSIMLSTSKQQSLADLLAQNSLVQVTSYGPAGHAGVRMRGGSADHTTVVWNGINIKPPMSGEINYSSLTLNTIDNIFIQPGGSNTMYGTGAATGVIYLISSMPVDSSGLSTTVNMEGGSFETGKISGNLSYSGKKFTTRFCAGYQMSANNFRFKNLDKFGKPLERLQHAAFSNYSFSQQNAIRFNYHSKLESDIWYTSHSKDIPSLTSSYIAGKTAQTDDDIRAALNYSYSNQNWFFKYRLGLLASQTDYQDYSPTTNTFNNTLHKSFSFVNEIEGKYNLNPLNKIYLGINNTRQKASSESYVSSVSRNHISLFGRYNVLLFRQKLKLNSEIRQEIVDSKLIPFVCSAGWQFDFIKNFALKAIGSKLYSLPDLNDLYWGENAYSRGNPNLKPESGWSGEVGVIKKINGTFVKLSNEFTYYTIQMKDAIVWLPSDSDGKWEPQNYNTTHTEGIEYVGQALFIMENSSMSVDLSYAYTDSKAEKSDSDKTLIQRRYIPKHKAVLALAYSYRKISIMFTQSYVGKRKVDESSLTLDPYLLANLSVNYRFLIKKVSISSYIKIENLYNTNYQVMAGYAQPPLAYYAGINFKF